MIGDFLGELEPHMREVNILKLLRVGNLNVMLTQLVSIGCSILVAISPFDFGIYIWIYPDISYSFYVTSISIKRLGFDLTIPSFYILILENSIHTYHRKPNIMPDALTRQAHGHICHNDYIVNMLLTVHIWLLFLFFWGGYHNFPILVFD